MQNKKANSGFFNLIQKIEEFVLAYGIIVIAVLAIINVFSRTLFNMSFTYVEELSQFLIIGITFIGTSYATGKARHIRMSALYDQLPEKARKAMMIFIASATSLLMFMLTYYAVLYTGTVMQLGTRSAALQVPFWIVYALAPLGLFMTGIQYFLTVIKNLQSEAVYLSFEHKDEHHEEELPESLEIE